MTFSRTSAFFLGCLLAGSALGQAAANTTRTLTTEGVTFKLPPGMEWQSEVAANIAIKKDVKVGEQTHTITADLVYNSNAFLEDTIADIEKKVAASKGDLRDFKVTRGEKFGATPATLVTLTRVRGEKQDQFEDERNYIFRRNNALYQWTERYHRSVSGQASSALSAARNGLTFLQKDLSRVPKTWADAGVKYSLPADFEYDKTAELPPPGKGETILSIETIVTVKGAPWRVNARLVAEKFAGTLDDVEKQAKDLLTKNFKDVKDYKLLERQDLKGEKAICASFSGVYVPETPAPDQPRVRLKVYFFKRKGYLLRWIEATPEETNPALETALKKAKDGLVWL